MAGDFRDINLKIQNACLLNDWAIAWMSSPAVRPRF